MSKSVDVDAVKNLMNDKVESLSDAEVYPDDDDDSENDRVTGFG